MNDLLLVLVVVTALCFDFTNGFHDTGNAKVDHNNVNDEWTGSAPAEPETAAAA